MSIIDHPEYGSHARVIIGTRQIEISTLSMPQIVFRLTLLCVDDPMEAAPLADEEDPESNLAYQYSVEALYGTQYQSLLIIDLVHHYP